MLARVATGSPGFVVDATQRICAWNRAIAERTGITAVEAIGRPCWEVMRRASGGTATTCRDGCSVARSASAGWPTRAASISLCHEGERRTADFLTVVDPTTGEVLHLLHVAERATPVRNGFVPPLTGRQREVLALLADGVTVRAISHRLVLSESTVRNHVRAILRAFDVHSMLQAVAEARRYGLV